MRARPPAVGHTDADRGAAVASYHFPFGTYHS
jgi:hypothetical protein